MSHVVRKTKVPLWRIVKVIVYRLKIGYQWRESPVRVFCDRGEVVVKQFFIILMDGIE